MRYPSAFLERLRSATSVSGVIGARIPIRRHGREFMALCPFHKEKTPSFTINDEKGFYHCFGCGAHGDAIGFIKDYEGVSYKEAIEKLADELGIGLPQPTQEAVEEDKKRRGLQDINELACRWFEDQLRSTAGYEAREYLAQRGLDEETISRFRLGFAPDDRQALVRFLQAEGVEEKTIIAAGLAIKPEGRELYARFRGRITFAIRDVRSQVVAFGGRLLSKEAQPNAPKYLNSPETELFHKGQMLYNVDLARRAARDGQKILVCEGYTDVIALAQAGIETAVAPLGTAITATQLQQLWQICDEPVLCLDGDAAGMRAMSRAAEVALPLLTPGKSLRFMTLPQGEDPDSLVRSEGNAAFRERVNVAQSMVDMLCRQVLAKPATTPEERAGQEQALLQMAEQIQHLTVRAHYREHIRQQFWARREKTQAPGMRRVRQTQVPMPQAKQLPHLPGSNDFNSRKARSLIHAFALFMACPELLENGEVETFLVDLECSDSALQRVQQRLLSADGQTGKEGLLSGLEGALSVKLTREMAIIEQQDLEDKRLIQRLWQQAATGYRQACLLEEYQQAEREMAQTMTQERFERFSALKQELEQVERQYQQWQQEQMLEES